MTKSELISRLATRFPQLVAMDADFAVRMILDAMTSALVRGDRIETRGFGSCEIRRNPISGEKVQVPAKCVPRFKAGKKLRERAIGATKPLIGCQRKRPPARMNSSKELSGNFLGSQVE